MNAVEIEEIIDIIPNFLLYNMLTQQGFYPYVTAF